MRIQALSSRRLALGTAAVVVVLDQLTKVWAVAELSDQPIYLIDRFFRLALIRNPGAAFGLLRGAGSILALLAIAAAAAIVMVIRRIERPVDAVALGLVLGGAVGNLIDRVVRDDGWLDGRVVDFLDFSFFPAFNLADTAITLGAMLALWEALSARSTPRSPTTSTESGPTASSPSSPG